MKITELRLAKLFSVEADAATRAKPDKSADIVTIAGGSFLCICFSAHSVFIFIML